MLEHSQHSFELQVHNFNFIIDGYELQLKTSDSSFITLGSIIFWLWTSPSYKLSTDSVTTHITPMKSEQRGARYKIRGYAIIFCDFHPSVNISQCFFSYIPQNKWRDKDKEQSKKQPKALQSLPASTSTAAFVRHLHGRSHQPLTLSLGIKPWNSPTPELLSFCFCAFCFSYLSLSLLTRIPRSHVLLQGKVSWYFNCLSFSPSFSFSFCLHWFCSFRFPSLSSSLLFSSFLS